jgi:hypothetical protein
MALFKKSEESAFSRIYNVEKCFSFLPNLLRSRAIRFVNKFCLYFFCGVVQWSKRLSQDWGLITRISKK